MLNVLALHQIVDSIEVLGINVSKIVCRLNIVKLRQGSGKERQGKARMAKGERP